jgi:hypothetical protein
VLGGDQIQLAIMAAIAGFFAAVIVLRRQFSARGEVSSPAARVAV